MIVQQVTPVAKLLELESLLDRIQQASALRPFSDEIVEFCQALSRKIFADAEAKRFPELQSLAFWMRKSEVLRMKTEFESIDRPPVRLAPRGLVFHIPPTNVDTISIYSLLLALLTGNRNIVRLSPRAAVQSQILVRLLNAELANASPALQSGNVVVSYGRDLAINTAISAACDVRVIWGGDATVNSIRSIPLSPHGRDISFPDRYSLCAVAAEEYLKADENTRRELSVRFFNDVFWFDQMACSSPHLIAWCGRADSSAEASKDFYERVGSYAASRGLVTEPATRIAKFTFACRAILDRPVTRYDSYGNELSVVSLEGLSAATREHSGGGLLYQLFLRELGELVPFVQRRDQTLTHFGFPYAVLDEVAQRLNGRGLDRIVPIGEALSFRRHWDGMDLFQELTRAVYIMPGRVSPGAGAGAR